LKLRLRARDVIPEKIDHCSPCHVAKIRPAPSSDGERAVLDFPIPRHQHVGDLGFFSLTDLKADFFIAQIGVGSKAGRFQLSND
jgi:hypothetical protein